jgi:hypothetical protein
LEFRISDGERARYTAIYGVDPLASDGWLIRRLRENLSILGYELDGAFDLLAACDGETIRTRAIRGTGSAFVRIENARVHDTRTFRVSVA